MTGRYSVTDLLGRCYWRTDDMRDAYDTAVSYTAPRDWKPEGIVSLILVRDELSGRTVYVKNGRVSVYVQNGVDVDRPRSRVA